MNQQQKSMFEKVASLLVEANGWTRGEDISSPVLNKGHCVVRAVSRAVKLDVIERGNVADFKEGKPGPHILHMHSIEPIPYPAGQPAEIKIRFGFEQVEEVQQEEQQTARRLATIRVIAEINPIPGADAIECATVDGWNVVVKKGEFVVGDKAAYFEIDSWLPASNPAFNFLMDKSREYQGVVGVRLKTIRLRGQLSQGLLLPLAVFGIHPDGIFDGEDMTQYFGVLKWERPMNANLAGTARGNFPSFIPKTDQERIQNIYGRVMQHYADKGFEVSIKLDGSSMTVYRNGEDVGVCSRNLDLVETEGNSFWKAARDQYLIDALQAYGQNIALQGELIGEGIQGNPEGICGRRMYIFDIYDIDAKRYLLPTERALVVIDLQNFGADIRQVQILGGIFTPSQFENIGAMLKFAEGKCSIGGKNEREGLVWKDMNSDFSFKTISNKFLLKGGD